MLLVLFALTCKQSNASEEQTATEFKSTQYLYENCKLAVTSNDFLDSPCAIYIEGYIGGYRTGQLQMLARATKQREIIEKYDRSKCRDLDSQMSKDGGVQWLAGYFVNWMEKNQHIVAGLSKDDGRVDKEAYRILNLITTDERFCTTGSVALPEVE